LTGRREVDAFMMEIGPYVVIEFSKKPNACYVYEPHQLPFNRYERHYDGGTEDLAAGFHVGSAARIVHTPGWQPRAERELRALGILPDAPGSQVGAVRAVRAAPVSTLPTPLPKPLPTPLPKPIPASAATPPAPAPSTAASWISPVSAQVASQQKATHVRGPNMATLEAVVATFPGAFIDDRRRNANGGRLWVEDPSQNVKLADELRHIGFKWANSRLAWYYPEQ
jgi:hypothetical protein